MLELHDPEMRTIILSPEQIESMEELHVLEYRTKGSTLIITKTNNRHYVKELISQIESMEDYRRYVASKS